MYMYKKSAAINTVDRKKGKIMFERKSIQRENFKKRENLR